MAPCFTANGETLACFVVKMACFCRITLYMLGACFVVLHVYTKRAHFFGTSLHVFVVYKKKSQNQKWRRKRNAEFWECRKELVLDEYAGSKYARRIFTTIVTYPKNTYQKKKSYLSKKKKKLLIQKIYIQNSPL